jgi:hypothetical protein
MPKAGERLAIRWQKPSAEAHWVDTDPPAEAPALEAAVRAALEPLAAGRELLVVFRRDGTRWRVQAELGNARGASPDADPRSTLDLTRRAVEALRRAGFQAEPGFPADPNEPGLAVGPTE